MKRLAATAFILLLLLAAFTLYEKRAPDARRAPAATNQAAMTDGAAAPSAFTPEELAFLRAVFDNANGRGAFDDFAAVWGRLTLDAGALPYATLTKAQRAMTAFPPLDPLRVYWTRSGGAYHAVSWCYTLWRSGEIIAKPLAQAGARAPCSKCVAP